MIRRYLALVLAVALAAIALVNPMHFELQLGQSQPTIETTVQARDLSLVCPGALFQAGGTSGTSLKNIRVGSAALVGALTNSQLSLEGGPIAGRIVEPKSFTAVDRSGLATQGSALLNVAQAQLVQAKNLSGLAAATCMRPLSDLWLIGGDTTVGRETLIIMTNPTEVDATVDLQILGTGGLISAPGLSSISVPAGKTTVIPVSSLAPNLSTFAIHVSATGGALGAWLQQRTIRSLIPGGVDYIAASLDASKSLVIPGIYLRGTKDAERFISKHDDYTDLRPMLRLTNATDRDANVTAQILGANSSTFGTVVQKVVPAHSTVDVVIEDLEDGDYFSIIDSSSPIRASMRVARTKQLQNDFAWLAAADAFTAERAVSTPAGSVSKLALVNAGTDPAVVTMRSGDSSTTYSLKPKTTVSVVVTPGVSTFVSSTSPVAANVVIDIDGYLAVAGVLDYKNLGGTVAITVR